LVEKCEELKLLRKTVRWWEDNIEMDFKEIRMKGMNWIRVAQVKDKWQVCVKTTMNRRLS
jgi:hypothetical protein